MVSPDLKAACAALIMFPMNTLEQLQFDNSYAALPESFHSRLQPTPFSRQWLIHFNEDAAALLDLDPREAGRTDFVDRMTGRRPLAGMDPVAMCYAGHQFGHYVPRLGDGRAILLGEVRNLRGERWDLHLKGSGPTPYSRDGDGRAVLRSSIREYLCSEAMHGLGIPTSRALCLIGSDEEVFREHIEPGAMLVRLAPSHVRFGHFEYFYYSNQFDHLQRLADYVLDHHFPELREGHDRYIRLLDAVVSRTAQLIAAWQAVGFAHGVMNTDNMSVLGLTLDYGPFGFLDAYEPGHICNHSDHHGRYAFDQQPTVALFNLSCFAQALLPLLHEQPQAAAEVAREQLGHFEPWLIEAYGRRMRAKLGLREPHASDRDLTTGLLNIMAKQGADFTLVFRRLAQWSTAKAEPPTALRELFGPSADFDAWAAEYRARVLSEAWHEGDRQHQMLATNPKFVLRNHLAQAAIEDAQRGDYRELKRLFELLRQPFAEHPQHATYAQPAPAWARQLHVSCSS